MTDTIAAIATAPGMGGVSIVRVSGPESERILTELFRPAGKKSGWISHMLTYGHVLDGGRVVDECMAVLMRAPRSYTREDVAELQLHGGGYTAQEVLMLCLRYGARMAEPGEFTKRAFLNGRIDLSRAEAVMDVIAAQGRQAHDAAVSQLQGGAAGFIRGAADELYAIQAGVAACIDYPEEITEEEATADLVPRTLALAEKLEAACDERSARILHEGFRCALCGRPNAGKSSLLNALLGEEKAIVTPIPGTTRDAVEGEIILNGALVRLTDTAGLRDTEDPVERIGVARARSAAEKSDCLLIVLDAHEPPADEDAELLKKTADRERLILLNKSDLPAGMTADTVREVCPHAEILSVSAAHPESLAPLKKRLGELAAVSDHMALTQPRHMEAAGRAAAQLRQAVESMREMTVDLAAVDLAAAQSALSEITGDHVEEKLLDQVFSRFCVGK